MKSFLLVSVFRISPFHDVLATTILLPLLLLIRFARASYGRRMKERDSRLQQIAIHGCAWSQELAAQRDL